jgi:hypothetical protein
MTNDMTNNIRKIINNIFAIPAACTAIPVKPSTPAIIATIRKRMTQLNIMLFLIKTLL